MRAKATKAVSADDARAPTAEAKSGGVDRRRTNMQAQILQAASELFFDHGFEATSIRMIVEACGVTPAAFYNHFATKEDLLYRIVVESHDAVGAAMKLAVKKAGDDPAAQLAGIVSAYVRFHAQSRIRALVANSEFTSLPEPRLSDIRDRRIALRGIFETTIRRGLKARVFSVPPAKGNQEARLAAVAIGDMCLRVAEWFRPDGRLGSAAVEKLYATYALRLVGVISDGA